MKTSTISKKGARNPKKKRPDIITQLERSLDDFENGRVIDATQL